MASERVANLQEYSVSDLSGAIKRALEDGFGYVRVRGELGRVTRPASGHVYLDLKDDKAVLSGVMWKGNAARASIQPEQGMEVVATGRISTFPGQSRYQIIIDALEPAGVGALMALLEERKKKLAAEGLFDADRKRDLPFLPDVVGVVTSPSGAVIRDILHRLRDRFPRHVLVWPTLVQGKGAEATIAAAIRGFNDLPTDGQVPRPDVLIVARGGGSLEDLWSFNEEVVVRAAAASEIPLISAVGHETDTTLIDYAADRRAPTPTAAAEMAVPVRSELLAETLNKARRLVAGHSRAMEARAAALRSASRGLGRPQDITGLAAQRLDRLSDGLAAAMRMRLAERDGRLARVGARLGPQTLSAGLERAGARVAGLGEQLRRAPALALERRRQALAAQRLPVAALNRRLADNVRMTSRLADRFAQIGARLFERRAERLDALAQRLSSVSHQNVLDRGFALVRGADGRLIRNAGDAAPDEGVSILFADGERAATMGAAPPTTAPSAPRRKPKAPAKASTQTSLFDD